MSEKAVLVEVDGQVANIVLNRPHVLNAMNMDWVLGFEEAVQQVAALPEVRVVVVKGKGRAFCAGLDLDMYSRELMPPGFFDAQERGFHGLERLDKITIAAIHGYCLGGGLQLAISCDLRVCSTDATLGLPAVNEGLMPGMAPYRLPRLIGLGPACRLILSGQPIGPDEAYRLGLVDYVVPAERFEERLAEVVSLYLKVPRMAAIASKRLMQRAFQSSFDDALAEARELIAQCLASPEASAAAAEWLERKRQRRSGSQG
ncbi:Short-chain-enoyl-CoA hydratase [bacterium HR24]|jgi:enoyl-CoA hydratase/carnithine racemase|nr:Short-chain-enoyl-CoA hydratase [bacterium HR24]